MSVLFRPELDDNVQNYTCSRYWLNLAAEARATSLPCGRKILLENKAFVITQGRRVAGYKENETLKVITIGYLDLNPCLNSLSAVCR